MNYTIKYFFKITQDTSQLIHCSKHLRFRSLVCKWLFLTLISSKLYFFLLKILLCKCLITLCAFFFLRRYNFREVLAFSTNSFHLDRFLTQSFQLVIPRFVTSLFTSSSHLFLGLPSDLVNAGDHSYTLLTMLSSGIRCTCPNQANLCALM